MGNKAGVLVVIGVVACGGGGGSGGDASGRSDAAASDAGAVDATLPDAGLCRSHPFTRPPPLHTAVQAEDIVVVDIDGDGNLDLVLAEAGADQVSVYRGHGDATFAPPVHVTGFGPASQLDVGDLDQDGDLDLAVAAVSAGAYVAFGDGSGGFGDPVQVDGSVTVWDIAIADVDADGANDLVVAAVTTNTVRILRGNGDGTFQLPVDYATSSSAPRRLAVGRINEDPWPDIVATADVHVLLGNGDGTFAPHVEYYATSEAMGIAIGDLDGDTIADVAVSSFRSDSPDPEVGILLGAGGGILGPRAGYPSGPFSAAIVIHDLNADGIPDLVTPHADDSTSSVGTYLGNGDGTFQPRVDHPTGQNPYGAAVADISGDCNPDLVVVNLEDRTIDLVLGHGDGTFD